MPVTFGNHVRRRRALKLRVGQAEDSDGGSPESPLHEAEAAKERNHSIFLGLGLYGKINKEILQISWRTNAGDS